MLLHHCPARTALGLKEGHRNCALCDAGDQRCLRGQKLKDRKGYAFPLLRLRLEGDFLQPPWLSVHRLDRLGRRRPLGQKRRQRQRKRAGFAPVLRDCRLSATLYVGVAADGALTVEALGLLHTLLEAAGRGFGTDVVLRPVPCFDKTICALRLSGIGRFVLAQNILEYLKGKLNHAKR